MTDLVRRAAGKILGERNVLELEEPSLAPMISVISPDAVPGCYFYIGVGNAEKGSHIPTTIPISRRPGRAALAAQ